MPHSLAPKERTTSMDDANEADKAAKRDHKENHKGGGEFMKDCIIGFADGLTVPFALTAGLSSLGSARLVIVGGLAELFAGSISMGLGAYLAALADRKIYEVEELRERREVKEKPLAEEDETREIFGEYGVDREACKGVVYALKANEDMWVRFMMDFELKLEKPQTRTAWIAGLVMGVSYFIGKPFGNPVESAWILTYRSGGLLPMIPYFAYKNVNHALFTSIGITVVILIAFGYIKAMIMGTTRKDAVFSAGKRLFIGVLAVGVSYGIAAFASPALDWGPTLAMVNMRKVRPSRGIPCRSQAGIAAQPI
ncbi:Protein ccc1 [Elasticomyces elasticus]|nr:Protein ccc1 [Elasticomyces elasticus]